MNAREGIPLVPAPEVLADRAVATFVRSIIALGLEKFPDLKEYGGGTPALAYVRRRWGGEVAAVEYLLATKALLETKGATAPAMTTTVGWAQELANIIPIFLPILTALSAGVPLLAKGFQLSFDRAAAISLPLISTSAAKFVGQGQAIPVVDFSVVPGKKLEPFKLASVCVLTFEMLASSNAEQIVRQALAESIAKGLDAVLFGVGDATADQPAGLLFGTPALTKSAATTKTDAMIDDISALAGAVARVAGSGEVVFVTALIVAAGSFRNLKSKTARESKLLVFRFRRSYHFAALAFTNVGNKGTLASHDPSVALHLTSL